MNILVLILIILLVCGGGFGVYGGWHTGFPGGPVGYGGGIGLVVVILLVVLLLGYR